MARVGRGDVDDAAPRQAFGNLVQKGHWIVLDGLRGEDSIAEMCWREGINQNLYYRWSKDFLEAGKKRLAGDTAREATSDEVKGMRRHKERGERLLR